MLCFLVFFLLVGEGPGSVSTPAVSGQVGCMIRRAKKQLAKKMEEWKRQDAAEALKEAAPTGDAEL